MGAVEVCPKVEGRVPSAPASAIRTTATTVGRYLLGPRIASGGMASVHLGRLRGSAGFARTVAIKRLLPELAKDPEFVARLCDEARIASRIRHANVVPTLDVVDAPEVLLVLEYVHAESLWTLLRLAASRGERVPPPVASSILIGVLRGLHAAHQAKDESGVPLELVHRDVSPQNVLVGADGVPRVLDFGIAKAAGREMSTLNKGTSKDVKGKIAYMAPEQISGEPLDRRADLFAAGVIFWETLAGERLFKGDDAVQTMDAIFNREPARLSGLVPNLSSRVDDLLATSLAKDPAHRYATAADMARAIEVALPPASEREVAEWVEAIGAEVIEERTAIVGAFERSTDGAEDDEPHDPSEAPTIERGPRVPSAALLPPPLRGAIPPPMLRDSATLASPVRTPRPTPRSVDPLSQSGMTQTRIGPIDLDSKRRPHHVVPAHTPLPMAVPISIPMPPPVVAPKPRSSFAKIATLVLLPPVIAAVALLGMRTPTFARLRAPAVSAPPSEAAEPPPIAQPIVTPPPLAAKVIEATPPSAPSASSAAPPAHSAKSPRPQGPRLPRRR